MIKDIIEGRLSVKEVRTMSQRKLNKALDTPWK
jgi:hypothetical protein